MTHPFGSQDERDAFRESLPASEAFVVPTSEVRMLLDALDAAERRAAEAEGDTALLAEYGAMLRAWTSKDRFTTNDPIRQRKSEMTRKLDERALSLARVATGGQEKCPEHPHTAALRALVEALDGVMSQRGANAALYDEFGTGTPEGYLRQWLGQLVAAGLKPETVAQARALLGGAR